MEKRMINVLGSGLAGLSASITLASKGYSVNLISKSPSERSQSILAEGGINAALDTMGEGDSPKFHFEDTMKGGCNLADPQAVEDLTGHAPETVLWLSSLGVPFSRISDKIALRNFGGQKKKRTAYAKSSTGKILMTSLIDEARKYEDMGLIQRYMHHALANLFIEDNQCHGLAIRDIYTREIISLTGPVILACGGLNGFFPELTTGTSLNDGEVQTIAFLRGVEFANLEFIQYHPTTIGISGKQMLISEAARGEGGRLFVYKDQKPWYFMEEKYPELGNLMPRDVVSREEYMIKRDLNTDIYLDMRSIPKTAWKTKLSDLRKEIIDYFHTDPVKTPVRIEPGIHFFMGGIYTDVSHHTSVRGLYAAGECACIYHGANRLGGNSLLGAVYGGRKTAETLDMEYEEVSALTKEPAELDEYSMDLSFKLRDILSSGLGIIRDEEKIKNAIEMAEELKKSCGSETDKARMSLGLAMLYSAQERKESRGAHYRSDYPAASEEFRKTTVASYRDGDIHIEFRAIGDEANVFHNR